MWTFSGDAFSRRSTYSVYSTVQDLGEDLDYTNGCYFCHIYFVPFINPFLHSIQSTRSRFQYTVRTNYCIVKDSRSLVDYILANQSPDNIRLLIGYPNDLELCSLCTVLYKRFVGSMQTPYAYENWCLNVPQFINRTLFNCSRLTAYRRYVVQCVYYSTTAVYSNNQTSILILYFKLISSRQFGGLQYVHCNSTSIEIFLPEPYRLDIYYVYTTVYYQTLLHRETIRVYRSMYMANCGMHYCAQKKKIQNIFIQGAERLPRRIFFKVFLVFFPRI